MQERPTLSLVQREDLAAERGDVRWPLKDVPLT